MTTAGPATGVKRYLVIGATGHVGSKIAGRLAEKGLDVTALVRRPGMTIEDPYSGDINYVVGDLPDEAAMKAALVGIDVVISTANGIVPQKKGDDARSMNGSAVRLEALCEEAGVQRFVQSSVPSFKGDSTVPELKGKRLLERRLERSAMQTIIVRNPAFMDVWLPLGRFRGAEDRSRHATVRRDPQFTSLGRASGGCMVAQVEKARTKQAGLDPAAFARHSLRIGFLTSAARAGTSIWKMQEQSRHKSLNVLSGYVRSPRLFEDHPGKDFT